MPLRPGDPAPDFRGRTDDGSEVGLANYRGRTLVLYFYPMDFTPGCTAQACSLRDGSDAIRDCGAEILGVSRQGADTHRRFRAFYRLPFPLLADPDGAVARAYGAAGGSGLFAAAMNLAGMSERKTFIIDAAGRIAHVVDRPSCGSHADEVLRLLRPEAQAAATPP